MAVQQHAGILRESLVVNELSPRLPVIGSAVDGRLNRTVA